MKEGRKERWKQGRKQKGREEGRKGKKERKKDTEWIVWRATELVCRITRPREVRDLGP